MLFIPLPFVVALLLLILFWTVTRRGDEAEPNRPFLALILVSALLSVLQGLRWGYGMQEAGAVAPILAAIAPPLVYAGISRLVRADDRQWPARLAVHALPAVIVLVLLVIWRDAIDIALIAIDLVYAAAILLLVRSGADGLRLASFEAAAPAYRAVILAASALCLSAMVDAFVFLDIEWAHGAHAATAIGIANLLALAVLGMAAAVASRGTTPVEAAEPLTMPDGPPATNPQQDTETIRRIDELMRDRKLYRDANLNLSRLARRAGIPARQISAAINRATARNVSQYVNEQRIAEACRLLSDSDRPVTEIMFAVGFQTKSNFNREFRRVTGVAPIVWRERNARDAAPARQLAG